MHASSLPLDAWPAEKVTRYGLIIEAIGTYREMQGAMAQRKAEAEARQKGR